MTKRAKRVTIFYCYHPIDKLFRDDLAISLTLLKRSGQVDTWSEDQILGGADLEHEIEQHLRESDIVLLLMSPEFLASDHCQIIKKQAVELREANKISSVIPILLRPSIWEQDTIGKLNIQPLPKDRRPISMWENRDEAFKHMAEEIKKVVESLLNQPQQSDVREGFRFIGHYPTNGYRWDSDLRPAPGLVNLRNMPDAPWLVSQAVGILELNQGYSIFDKRNTVRDFTKLSPTAEAIKQFADNHGHLANDDLVPLYYPEKVGRPDSILWAGESLQFWLEEIEEMNILVTLWDLIQKRQIEALQEHIIWRKDPLGVLFTWKGRYGSRGTVIGSEKLLLPGELFYQWKWGEVVRPALHYLCSKIETQLNGHVNVTPTIFPDGKIEIEMVPDSLRAALYVLLLMEVRERPIEAK